MLIADAEQISLGPSDDLAPETVQVFTVEGREIGVFRREGNWFAIDNHCPHKGASLAAGQCGEDLVDRINNHVNHYGISAAPVVRIDLPSGERTDGEEESDRGAAVDG